MKIVKFKDERGNDLYGLRKFVITYEGDLYCKFLYYDFHNNGFRPRREMSEGRYMNSSARTVLDKYDAILIRDKNEKEAEKTKRGVVIHPSVLRERLENQEDDESVNNRHERWGVPRG